MKKFFNILFMIFLCFIPLCVQAEQEDIRIWLKIFDKRDSLILYNRYGLSINENMRNTMTSLNIKKDGLCIACNGKKYNEFSVKPVKPSRTIFRTKFGEKEYNGTFHISIYNGSFKIINTAALNSYLTAVAGAELGDMFSMETLKAQAVVSRTYFYKVRDDYSQYGVDVIDLAGKCQAFRGMQHAGEKTQRAVFETTGEILRSGDKDFIPYFHSTCGGMLLSPDEAWHGKMINEKNITPRYDGSMHNPNCSISPYYQWNARIDKNTILSSLSNRTGYHLNDIKFYFTREGILSKVSCFAKNKIFDIKGFLFKAYLEREGIPHIRSTRFTVDETGGEYFFRGKGFGHFVGMCQWGAEYMARKGIDYRSILKYYFPQADIVVERK